MARTEKLAVAAPSRTETEFGTERTLLLLLVANVTVDEPVGMAWGRVTVQIPEPADPTALGLHSRVNVSWAGLRFNVAETDVPL